MAGESQEVKTRLKQLNDPINAEFKKQVDKLKIKAEKRRKKRVMSENEARKKQNNPTVGDKINQRNKDLDDLIAQGKGK